MTTATLPTRRRDCRIDDCPNQAAAGRSLCTTHHSRCRQHGDPLLGGPREAADTPSGVTTFTALCERTGQAVPTTHRTRTASGGEHLYFTAPTGARLTNIAGKLGELIDTRAWGGYVVATGSTPRSAHTRSPTPPRPSPCRNG